MHATYQAHLTFFDIYYTNCAFIIRDWKRRHQSKEPRTEVIVAHAETPEAWLQSTLQWFFNIRACFPYVLIKTTSSNSVQFFSYVLCLLALISFSLPLPYLFLSRYLSLNFLWRNDHGLRHLLGTFRVKERTVSEIKGLSQYSSIFPISFQSKRVDDLLIRRKRQNWLHSIHEFQFHRSQKFILSFASSIRLDSLHLLHL